MSGKLPTPEPNAHGRLTGKPLEPEPERPTVKPLLCHVKFNSPASALDGLAEIKLCLSLPAIVEINIIYVACCRIEKPLSPTNTFYWSFGNPTELFGQNHPRRLDGEMSVPLAPTPTSISSVEEQEPHRENCIPRSRTRACAKCSQSKVKCKWTSKLGEASCDRFVCTPPTNLLVGS
jgi:hypothetical protein